MFNQRVSNFGSAVNETALTQHLRQTFNYMTGGVALSGMVAWMTLGNPDMMAMAIKSQWVFFAIWIGFAFFMHKIIFSVSTTAALGIFVAFSALTGFSLSPLAMIYTGSSIATAFFVAAAMFAGAAVYGYTTKKSMAPMATVMSMVGVGLFAAIIVNMFVQSSGFSMLISMAVIPFVALAVAFQMNTIKKQFAQFAGDEIMRSKMAIFSAASLYMDFVVMFIHLLNLLGVMRDE